MTPESIPGFADGGCLCGAVRYRVTGAPESSNVCHCRSCRLATGAPAVAWVTFARDRVQWLQGEPATTHTSPGVVRGFCARCGTPLTYRNDEDAGTIDLTTATLDHPEVFPPTHHVWVEHRIRWQPMDPALPHHPHGSASEPVS